ncbi:hypothetical protein [Kaarinaea lacus]
MKNKTIILITKTLLILTLLSIVSACNEAEEESTTDPSGLTLPPVASMSIDFNATPQTQSFSNTEIGVVSTTATTSSSYFNFAAFNVGGWTTLIKIGMAIPVAAFLESFNHRPVRQPDGSWIWSYSVTVADILHTAQLHGKIENEQVLWDMYISKEGAYTRFNWFSGVSELGGGSGYWVMNKNPLEPVPLLRIDWNWDRVTDTGDVRYTNIEPEGAENGGYIHYGNNAPDPYQAFYDIYNKGQDNLIEIEMNVYTYEGRVKNLQHFGNEDWHYWDSNLQDTTPPAG